MQGVRDNFYILLELGYDPPVTDSGQIKDAIHRKKQEWTRAQDNPSTRSSALRWLNMAEEIERVMLNDALRQQQATEAKAIRTEMLRQFEAELRVLEGKGYLTPKEAAAVAVKYKAYGVTKDMVAARARCPVTDSPPPRQAVSESRDILDRFTAKNIRRNLEVLSHPDLYAFLEQPPYSSVKKLTEATEQKRREAQSAPSKNAQSAAAIELCGLCQGLFADFASKQRYDQYLKVSKYPALNDLLDEEFNRNSYISPEVLLRMVNFGVEKYALKVLDAEEYIRQYCAAYEIPIDNLGPQIACPACSAAMPRDATVCTSCGAPLAGQCPSCGTPFEMGPAICSGCGFPLSDMAKALGYLDDGQNALIENNWGTAQRNVQYAKKYWPGHPQIESLEKRAHSLEDRYAWYVENVADCVRHNQYYAAQELIEEAKARRLRLPLTTTEHVEKVIADFEAKLAALEENPPFDEILELAAMVEDSIELSRYMAKHPPEPPASLSIQQSGKTVYLSWDKSPSPGMVEYVLVRKGGSVSLTAHDGDVLYEGPANSFEDKRAQSLHRYYYSVYTRRRGAYSSTGATAGAVLIVPEIQGLQILPNDQGAQLTWDFDPAIQEVIIWRKLGGEKPTGQGEGIRLETGRIDGFTDHKIKNGVDYWYYIVAGYQVEGEKVYSGGVCESVTPRKFLAPIDDLAVVATGNLEDEYVVNWQNTALSDVILLASNKKPDIRSGDIVPVQELLGKYRKLDLEARQPGSARFQFPFSGGAYLFAAALLGKFATVGQSIYITNVKPVENPTYDVLEDAIYINFKWPPGITEAVAAYRFDRFPASPEETGTTAVRVSREQYDFDAGVVLREPEPTTYYVTLYSIFTTPDGNKVSSVGMDLEVSNVVQQEVFYRFRYKKRLFARRGKVSVSVSTAETAHLPGAVFVGKVGRMPLGKTDGVSLFEIEADTRVKGELTYHYNSDKLPKDLFVRMFLTDDDHYHQFRLLPRDSVRVT